MGSDAAVIIQLCLQVPVGKGKVKTLGFKLKSEEEIGLKSACLKSVCLRYFLSESLGFFFNSIKSMQITCKCYVN